MSKLSDLYQADLLPAFTGFTPAAFAFLTDLAANNEREWFAAHREDYDTLVHFPMVSLLADLTHSLAERGVPIKGDPIKSIFRINRDVRFSNDKSPYKTNIAAALSRSGLKKDQAIFYIQVAPKGCLAAIGFYQVMPNMLDALRTRLVERPETYRKVTAKLAEAGLVLETDGGLVRLPRGYEGDHDADIAQALRLKSFVTRRPLSDAVVRSPMLVKELADFADVGSVIHDLL